MKKIILTLIVSLSSLASAQVVEVSAADKVVFYLPTPTLEMEVMDLPEGGFLSLGLSYEALQNENQELQQKYPGYKLQPLVAQQDSTSLGIHIPEVGIHEETLLKQGQTGPYLNLQLSLSKEQVAKFKALAKRSAPILQLEIPVRTSFLALQVLEDYSSDSRICRELSAAGKVSGLIAALAELKQPEQMHYPQTFRLWKNSLLENCFEIAKSSVNSFGDLLNLRIQPKEGSFRVRAVYTQKKQKDVRMNLVPVTKFKMI